MKITSGGLNIANHSQFNALSPVGGFLIAGGALGWVDTAITGIVPINARIVVFVCAPTAAQDLGIRSPGDTETPNVGTNTGVMTLLGRPINGHLEFYRAASDNTYYPVAYFTDVF